MTKRYKIIDLFAGAGGFSLGAARAGFNICAAVELDRRAVDTHQRNFPESVHIQADIAELPVSELLKAADISAHEVDGIIGGPPCQGFSTIGKRHIADVRNNLFIRFFQIVNEIRPSFFIAENVCGILDKRYDFIRQNAFGQIRGYVMLDPLKVKASDYGAPTSRTRIFFIGYDPARVLPLSEEDFRRVRTKSSITVEDALAGLPLDSKQWNNGVGKVNLEAMSNESKDLQSFYNNATENIPSQVGDLSVINRYKNSKEVLGCIPTRHSRRVKMRYESLLYGQQDKVSKSVKLNPKGLCPTLRAGTGPDKGSFQAVRPIHYSQNRVITPREAARLQGFPDWFDFQPTIWHSFRQIGNSVSPIAAERILSVIRHKLK